MELFRGKKVIIPRSKNWKLIDETDKYSKNFSYLTLMKFFNIGVKIVLAAYLIRILEQDVLLLSTRARFILDVINDNVNVRNIPEAEIIKKLKKTPETFIPRVLILFSVCF